MKLILRTSVTHLGEPGDMVEVKRGYARNYLLPKGMAIEATESNLRAIGSELDKLRAAAAEKREQARMVAEKLRQLTLTMERKVADLETGSLYGSVSVHDIGDGLAAHGHEVNRGEIHLDHPIKNLGDYEVSISLAHGVKGAVNVTVVGEEGETMADAADLAAPEPEPAAPAGEAEAEADASVEPEADTEEADEEPNE